MFAFVKPPRIWRQREVKSEDIFESGEGERLEVLPVACLFACPLVAYVQAFEGYFADVSNIGQDTARCSAFYSLCRSALGALPANMALFRNLRRFLAGFMDFVWVCVVLVVCVACVAFVRVWS